MKWLLLKVFMAFLPITFVVSQVFWDSQVFSSQVLVPEGLAENKRQGIWLSQRCVLISFLKHESLFNYFQNVLVLQICLLILLIQSFVTFIGWSLTAWQFITGLTDRFNNTLRSQLSKRGTPDWDLCRRGTSSNACVCSRISMIECFPTLLHNVMTYLILVLLIYNPEYNCITH